MHRHLQKYFPLFLLLLFFFPMVEKELHAFEHKADLHCTATDKHFHTEEHSCDICDLTLTNTDPLPAIDFVFILQYENFSFQPFALDAHTPAAFQDLPSRAPPVA